jgi:hypothetical protein
MTILLLLMAAFPAMNAAAKKKPPKPPKTRAMNAAAKKKPPKQSKTSKKVIFCHRTGNGSFVRINVSKKATKAHLKHGDGYPGQAVPGQEGMWFDDSCAQIEAVHVESPALEFGPLGWGGWSCPAGTTVIGGGYRYVTTTEYPVTISEAAEPGAASGYYPDYPHYTFGDGETGWVVQNGETAQSLIVFADCLPASP